MESLSIDTGSLDAAPQWLQDDLLFPYEQGLRFVEQVVADGGIAAVDLAYSELPETTEQVLDPGKYLRAEAPRELAPLARPSSYSISVIGSWNPERTLRPWPLGTTLESATFPWKPMTTRSCFSTVE